MSDLNTKLDRFTAAILAVATEETERALVQLGAQREVAYTAAEEQLLTEVYRYIHSEVARIKSESGRQVSRHMLANKRALYLRRDQISAEVFASLSKRLADHARSGDYPQRLVELYREALATLGNPAEVRLFLRPQDMVHAPLLQAAAHQVNVQLLEGGFSLGGLIADAPAVGKRVDATFDTRLEELSGHFAELFGLSLSGEMDEGVMNHE